MPTEVILAVCVFLLAALGMAIGVIVTGKRLKGSCGGVMAPDGRVIGDCLCAREGKKACDRVEPAAPTADGLHEKSAAR